MLNKSELKIQCEELLAAYEKGQLGYSIMPEDSNPGFTDNELESRLAYFTLPMSLNYQRDSYKLWEAAKKTYSDPETLSVFSIKDSALMPEDTLRKKLIKHKVALQPNKHIKIWKTIAGTVYNDWQSLSAMLASVNYDFLKLKDLLQIQKKKGFPYLSGPKIFNYWSFIMMEYGKIPLINAEYIDIAPDTHITKCSVLLRVITEEEAKKLSKEEISKRWRDALEGSEILPIQMHPPLWFWSRNNFQYKLNHS